MMRNRHIHAVDSHDANHLLVGLQSRLRPYGSPNRLGSLAGTATASFMTSGFLDHSIIITPSRMQYRTSCVERFNAKLTVGASTSAETAERARPQRVSAVPGAVDASLTAPLGVVYALIGPERPAPGLFRGLTGDRRLPRRGVDGPPCCCARPVAGQAAGAFVCPRLPGPSGSGFFLPPSVRGEQGDHSFCKIPA